MTIASESSNIRELNNDLWMDILSRLPPKPLVTCKCLSKTFRLLVSKIIRNPTRPRPISGLVMNLPDRETILDCREGFFLCCSKIDGEYYVSNPVTNQKVVLPDPPQHDCTYRTDELCAFILDESSDVFFYHYKVFRFLVYYQSELADVRVHVYSSKTRQWEDSNICKKGIRFMEPDKPSAFINGRLFVQVGPSQFLMFGDKEGIMELRDLPIVLDDSIFDQNNYCLGVCEGRLHYAYSIETEFKVWMIVEEGNTKWDWKHRIQHNEIPFPISPEDRSTMQIHSPGIKIKIIAFHPKMDAIFLEIKAGFFCYDFKRKEALKVDLKTGTHLLDYVFSESLCSLAEGRSQVKDHD